MATFEESFLYPLILLLIGSGVLGVAVALLTYFLEDRRNKQQNKLEDLRKKREIKVGIASKMLEVYGSVAAKTFLSRMRREPISNIDEVLEKFCVGAYIVDSMLDSHYSSKTAILDRWQDFFDGFVPFTDATSLYFVKDRTEDKKSLEDDLNKIKKYFSVNKEINSDRLTADKPIDPKLWKEIRNLTKDKPYDDELWKEIDDLYWNRVSKIYKDVLELDIKVF
jgi:hypothetical protein